MTSGSPRSGLRPVAQLETEQRQANPTDQEQRRCRSSQCYKGNGSFDYYVRTHILLGYRELPAERWRPLGKPFLDSNFSKKVQGSTKKSQRL